MAVAGDVGRGSYDGFVLAVVRSVEGNRDIGGQTVTLDVAVAFMTQAPRELHVGISANGPALQLDPGNAYFLTLEDASDADIEELYLHPCGPAVAVSGADIGPILSAAERYFVIEPDALSKLEASDETDPPLGYAVVTVAGAAVVCGVALALFSLPISRKRRAGHE